jgi:hypothetical protein
MSHLIRVVFPLSFLARMHALLRVMRKMSALVLPGNFSLNHLQKKPYTRDFTKIPRWLKGNNTSFLEQEAKQIP